jgi:uncharacterized protein YceH (UPF0502 family)
MILLSPSETRVLGCLIEKELTTPDYYPLTLNSLATACNQTTNRDPVVAFDDRTVQEAADSLREKKLATVVFGSGSRVQKYRHNFLDVYELDRREVAILCVLLLRGPQTPGEVRQRAERMAGGFSGLPEVEACLDGLARGDSPLIRPIPAGLGRKEKRYVHLLSGEPSDALLNPVVTGTFTASADAGRPAPEELNELRGEVAVLRAELQQLREAFEAFKKQFEG